MSDAVDILDALTDVQVPAQATSPENGNTESNGNGYPNVVATYPDEASAPQGLMNAREFAAKLTIRRIQKKITEGQEPTPDDTVAEQQVYSAMRAKRNPLPVILVGGAARLSEETFEVFENLPKPGRGPSKRFQPSQMSDEKLLRLQAKLGAELAQLEAKLARVTESLTKRIEGRRALYNKRLAEMQKRGLTLADVDEAAKNLVVDNNENNEN